MRMIAALLTVVSLWVAPSAAFAAMPSSHSCTAAHSAPSVAAVSAHHTGAPCQHTERFGCLTGACAGPAAVTPDRAAAVVAPVTAIEAPAGTTHARGPRSAPPTPPPNS